MKLIKADHHRRVEIPGLPAPARRPVDIDKSQTGFAKLRSLRIYSFDANSEINGHAEDDEVLIVVLAGSVELTMSDHNSAGPQTCTLSAAGEGHNRPCAAYLPPHAAYRLVPRSDAEVAYARATPAAGPPPHAFTSQPRSDHAGVAVLFEESTYPQQLRLRLLQITATQHEMAVTLIEESEDMFEALIHVRAVPAERVATITTTEAEPAHLNSWDTLCVMPGDRPILYVAPGSSALVLVVLAA